MITDKKKDIEEIGLIGYRTAVNLFLYEENLAWDRFNIMLVANSVIIASLNIVKEKNFHFKNISCCLGISISIIWLLLMFRSFDYRDFYILKAREIESRYLLPYIDTINMGKDFAEGKEVSLNFGDVTLQKKMSWKARLIRGNFAVFTVVISFLTIYILNLIS